jgi:DNA (cytosine-5)-methyltransferase 1
MSFIEVCAGAGGLSCGLIKAGLKPILLIDNDKNCCKTLKINHDNIEIICDSFINIDYTKYIEKIDLLCGGVPCQSFSQAGQRKGLNDSRGNLLLEFINLIDKLKPKVFLIENVKGLTTLKDVFSSILKKLNTLTDYAYKYKILNANDYNVPQKRERLFIIGYKKELSFDFPEPQNIHKILNDVLSNVPISQCAKYSDEKIKLFKKIPQGGCWTSLNIEEQEKYLGKSFYSSGGKRGILHRLSMNKPSLTLLCSPSQKQTERCHPLYERPLSIREYARIQTFEDSYQFIGSMSSQYKQIGNAVPVELAFFIGQKILKTIKNL